MDMAKQRGQRVVLITGETSGFGLEMAKLFRKEGDLVCGFSRHSFTSEGIDHQIGDITNEEDCFRCVRNVIDRYGRIDVLINNAGFGVFGPIEETTISKARHQIDVTLMGPYLMARAALPFLRENGGGRIINISSIGGEIPLPFQAFYSASKAGMDRLFDALRAEVYPYHIQITSIRPGDAKTGFTARREAEGISKESPYRKACLRCLKAISQDEQQGFAPTRVAQTVLKVSQKKRAPYAKRIGAKDRFLASLYHLLPQRVRNYLLFRIYAA